MKQLSIGINVSEWKLEDINNFCMTYNCEYDVTAQRIILLEVIEE